MLALEGTAALVRLIVSGSVPVVAQQVGKVDLGLGDLDSQLLDIGLQLNAYFGELSLGPR